MYQTKTRRNGKEQRKRLSGDSRLVCQDENIVTVGMGSVSMGAAKEAIEVPSLAAYAKGAASHGAKDCRLAKIALPAIPKPQLIPLNFSSSNEYLKVVMNK